MTVKDSLSQNIEFRNVEFTYPTQPDHIIFKKLNLDFPAGKIIVGFSGNGKSTIPAFMERYIIKIKNYFVLYYKT